MAEEPEPALFTLDLLPQELLVHILSFPQVEVDDLLRVSQVCSQFRDAVCCNELWKRKFARRFPDLFRQYTASNTRWREECMERLSCGVKLRSWMSMMSRDFYAHDELSEDAFRGILSLSDHPRRLLFFNDELATILEDDQPHEDLTLKYYARRVQCHVCHEHMKQRWESYLGGGDDASVAEPILEEGALLLSQWCQPLHRVPADWVRHTLDELARRAKAIAAAKHPGHPIVRCDWQLNHSALQESRWSVAECRSLLGCINHALFHEFGLSGDRVYFHVPENSFIDKVLEKKTGIPLTMCVIYGAVARRLGVHCLPVNFPTHFLLKFLEHPQLPEEQRYTYIDVYHGGRFLAQGECPSLCPNLQLDRRTCFTVLRTPKVLVRMCWNLVEAWRQFEGNLGMQGLRYALELLELFEGRGRHRSDPMRGDIEHRLLLARVYLHLGINYEQILCLLKGIEAAHPASSGIVAYMYRTAQSQMVALEQRRETRSQRQPRKLRSEPRSHAKVAYAVGMIMRHKKYHYHCVIYGWDGKCAANRDWIFQMGVHNLSHEDRQPFYNVLVEDGSNRYAAQENLEISSSPEVITHPDVGKYFERFCGTHYLPNAEKEHEYPEDAEVRDKLLLQTSHSGSDEEEEDEEESCSI
uniref:F-box protein 21 n=1 Tax=Rhipicephalus appendiculatus TaxID=34631 RepID=A0A131YXL5_RHIAP